MEASIGKEAILKNIRKALTQSVDEPFPGIEKREFSFEKADQDLSVCFAERFTSLLGRFSFSANEEDLVNQINALVVERGWTEIHCADDNIRAALSSFGFPSFSEKQLADVDVSITKCEVLVARTGSMVLSSTESSGRLCSVYAPVHICIAKASQLVYDVKDAIAFMQKNTKTGFLP